ncbi:MAG: hypothetical protein Phog2KO_17810 [Phototrophicaceae bacterium]
MSLYWLEQTIAVLPLVLWVYIALGVPWALLILPRSDWSQKITILALSFALGPALLTAWMLILGTIGGAQESALLRFDLVMLGTIILALIGGFFAWRKYKNTEASSIETQPLAFDEKLLITLIIIAVAIRWLVTAYWSFTAYDALWVYGYEGRLYQLLGYIPETIGYYPQFLPLQFTFMQLLSDGFDDHAARAVVPFIHLGSILASYVLGARLVSRRVGIILASIWTFYPHVAEWAHIGDLEIPLTFTLTLTMAFFLLAWTHTETFYRRRYALIAGICFGIAMWTKPTGGAFIYGVILLVFAEFVRVRFDIKQWMPRFEVAVLTGLACIPLGSIWYLRNVLLGLPALVFPHESWLTRATRSGDLLSFPIFALLLLIAYLASTRKLQRAPLIFLGVILLLVGAMPSSPLFNELRRDPPQSYLSLLEISAIITGLSLIIYGLWEMIKANTAEIKLSKVTWAYLLILPYFMTWFWSYSYHARLSFPIVPVMILPIAIILAHWIPNQKVKNWHISYKLVWSVLLVLLAIPALRIPITDIAPTSNWLWTDQYPTDFIRTRLQNPGVSLVAEQLWGYESETGITPIVIAPGEQRLRFFLPHADIITDTVPTQYTEIESATHYLYGSLARWRYENDEGIPALNNQIVAGLGRDDLFRNVLTFGSGTFSYRLYELSLDNRRTASYEAGNVIEEEVIFGGFVRYVGDGLSNTQLVGNRVSSIHVWEVLDTPPSDFHIRIDLVNIEDGQIYETWINPIAQTDFAYYNSEVWEIGEFIVDRHSVLAETADIPRGSEIYRFVINLIDTETGENIPMTIDGEPADGYQMITRFSAG